MKKVIIAFCLISTNLIALYGQSLEQDPLIHYYFDEEEISALQSITSFFDEHVTQDCDQSVSDCLVLYAKNLADTILATQSIPDIFDDALLASLLDNLSPTVLGEIWHYGRRQEEISADSTAHYWEMNYYLNGRYFKYLSATSFITDTTLKSYVEPAEASGDLSPSMVASLLLNHHLFDLNHERNRLIFAIHCITLDKPTIPWVDKDVLWVTNERSDSVYVELRAYPAEGDKNNHAGAFHNILSSQQTFTLGFNGVYFSEKNTDLSVAIPKYKQDEFEILVYQSIGNETVIYGNTPKDTLLVRKYTVQELIEQSPINIAIR